MPSWKIPAVVNVHGRVLERWKASTLCHCDISSEGLVDARGNGPFYRRRVTAQTADIIGIAK